MGRSVSRLTGGGLQSARITLVGEALVTRNDLDVQFVTVYRIEAVVGGPPRGPGVGG